MEKICIGKLVQVEYAKSFTMDRTSLESFVSILLDKDIQTFDQGSDLLM